MQAILKVHTRNMQLEDTLSILPVVAAITPGLTGAELASVANEAAIRAARRGSVKVCGTIHSCMSMALN
jgi:cell division protease FtsH